MVIESKEEVFAWFRGLSGSERVEVMHGLLSTSIPLEWRLTATLVENLAKKDYIVLKEDEFRANSSTELHAICNSNWLVTEPLRSPVPSTNGQKSDTEDHDSSIISVSSGGSGSTRLSSGTGELGPRAIRGTRSGSSSPTFGAPERVLNVTSKMVVYLCLLSSSNRVCATIIAEALKRQLSVEKLNLHLENVARLENSRRSPSDSKSPSQQASIPTKPLDPNFSASIVLMLTIAKHHPAFSLEQQDALGKQLAKLQRYMDGLQSSAALAPAIVYAPRPTNSTLLSHPALPLSHGAVVQPNASISFDNIRQQVNEMSSSICVSRNSKDLSSNSSNGPAETNNSSSPPTPAVTPDTGSDCSSSSDSGIKNNSSNHVPVSYMFPPGAVTPEFIHHYAYQQMMMANASIHGMPGAYWSLPGVTIANSHISPSHYTTSPRMPNEAPFHEPRPKPTRSCYNCGEEGHLGNECSRETLEDVTRSTNFSMNFVPTASEVIASSVPLVMATTHPATTGTTTTTASVNGHPPPNSSRSYKNRPSRGLYQPPSRNHAREANSNGNHRHNGYRDGGDRVEHANSVSVEVSYNGY